MPQGGWEKASHDSQKAGNNACNHHDKLVFKIQCDRLEKGEQSCVNQSCPHKGGQKGCDWKGS